VAQVEEQVTPCHGVVVEHGFCGGDAKFHGYPILDDGVSQRQLSPSVLLYKS
jgi:hypothetical protein